MGGQRQSSALRVEKGSADIVMWEAGLLQRPHLNGPPQGLGGILRPESHIPQLGCGPLMDEQRAQAGKECRNGRGLGYQHLWASSALWPFDMILPCPEAMTLAADTVSKLVTPPTQHTLLRAPVYRVLQRICCTSSISAPWSRHSIYRLQSR